MNEFTYEADPPAEDSQPGVASSTQDGQLSDLSSDEKETNPVSSEDALDWERDQENESAAGRVQVAIDWAELEGALENNSPDLHSFLNKQTGDVIRIFSGNENVERRLQDVEADPAYLYIEPISSREQYRWMEEFIETLEDCPLKDRLLVAVDGKGAFRRFKDVLVDDAEKREMWFEMRSKKLQAHIAEWLAAKNIAAANSSPWEEGASTRKFETVRRNRYGSSHTKSFGTNQRRVAHEMVDLIPSKELPIAVAFLEFLSKDYKSKNENNE